MSTTYHSNEELKATRPQHGTVAIVSGFYTMGDGGHGMYVYDANSNFPDDGFDLRDEDFIFLVYVVQVYLKQFEDPWP